MSLPDFGMRESEEREGTRRKGTRRKGREDVRFTVCGEILSLSLS